LTPVGAYLLILLDHCAALHKNAPLDS